MSIDSDTIQFHVVINPEQQYSIWPGYRDIPAGWQAVGVSGTRAQCLEYIDAHWTDMRPASLRARMDGGAGNPAGAAQPQ
jgi:MbtH protein